MNRILIIDFYNTFIKAYITNPALTPNGDPVGGVFGTLKSLQKACKMIKPSLVIVAYDGRGGSSRRRSINKNYKEGRKVNLNRFVDEMDEQEHYANRVWQIERATKYLKNFPIYNFCVDNVEADDIISFVCSLDIFSGDQKVIVSSDKDFIQLLNDKVILYRPTQEEILNTKRAVEKYNLHPNNFATARAIAGDKSDNIEGVKSVGLPTLAKRFPFLSDPKWSSIDDILNYSRKMINDGAKQVAYERILAEEQKIKVNYQLVNLSYPRISVQSKQNILGELKNKTLKFNKTNTLKMFIEDGITESNFSVLFQKLESILLEQRRSS